MFGSITAFCKLFLTFILLTACAPPPGSYDPKTGAKIKGAVIEKSERFVEPKCTSANSNSGDSLVNLSLTSNSSKSASINFLPMFRTVSINQICSEKYCLWNLMSCSPLKVYSLS